MNPPVVPDFSPERIAAPLTAFLADRWGRPVELAGWRRHSAGFSWITIGFSATVTAPGSERVQPLILRIGDPRGLLAPYHAEPEFRALQALQNVVGLPVPAVHGFCDDCSVIGAPFLITGFVDGDTPMPWRGHSERRDPVHNASLSRDFIEAMAALHRFDWRGTALRDFWGDVPAAAVARTQVDHWSDHADLQSSAARRWPLMHYARRWLLHRLPTAERVVVVHGDFRVGNFLQREGRLTAMLDWELVHPGDPHEDIAWAGLRVFAAGTDRIGGLVDRAEFRTRYVERTGFELKAEVLRFYEVLGLFKSAAMLIGAVRRIEAAATSDLRLASMGFQIASTLLELNRLMEAA